MATSPPQLPSQVLQKRVKDNDTQQALDNQASSTNTILQWLRNIFSFANGILTVNWPITVSTINVTKAINISNTSPIATTVGNLLVTGTLTVTGATTLSSTLGVTGAISGASLTTTGNITSSGSGTISTGGAISGGTITASTSITGGTGSFTTLSSSGAATLNSLGVTNNATVGGTLGVTGAITGASLSTTGNIISTGGNVEATGSGNYVYGRSITAGNNGTAFGPASSIIMNLASNSTSSQNYAAFTLNNNGSNPPAVLASTGGSAISWNKSGSQGESNWINTWSGAGTAGHTFDKWDGTTYTQLANISASGNFNASANVSATGTLYGANLTVGYTLLNSSNYASFLLNSAGANPNAGLSAATGTLLTSNHSNGTFESNYVNIGGTPSGHYFDKWNGTTYTNLAKIDGSGNFTGTGNIATTNSGSYVYGTSIVGGNNGTPAAAGGNSVMEMKSNSTSAQNYAAFSLNCGGTNPSTSFTGANILSWNRSAGTGESNWVNAFNSSSGAAHTFDTWTGAGATYANQATLYRGGKFVAGNGTAATSVTINGSAPGIKHCLGYYYYNGAYSVGNTVVSLLVAGLGLASTSWVTVMPFAGSVVAISFDAENLTNSGAITGYVYKNGSALCNSSVLTGTVGTLYTSQTTFTKATYTFAAGDTLDFRIKSFNSQTTLQAIMWVWVEMDG